MGQKVKNLNVNFFWSVCNTNRHKWVDNWRAIMLRSEFLLVSWEILIVWKVVEISSKTVVKIHEINQAKKSPFALHLIAVEKKKRFVFEGDLTRVFCFPMGSWLPWCFGSSVAWRRHQVRKQHCLFCLRNSSRKPSNPQALISYQTKGAKLIRSEEKPQENWVSQVFAVCFSVAVILDQHLYL